MILISTQNFPPSIGGIQSLMFGLAETALNTGRGAVVLADKSPGWRAHDAEQVLYIERYGGLKPLRRLIKARAVHRFVARRPTIICDSWKSLEYLSPLDAPITVLAHGAEFPARPSQMKTKRITKTLAKASAVIAASRFAADLVRPYLSGRTHLAVVNPPISPLPSAQQAAAELRAQHSGPVLVSLARLEPRKGLARVIEALPAMPTATFLIGGEGGDKKRLQELAANLGVASRVHFLGKVDDARKAALLSAADLFVMPTYRVGNSVEGFGIVYKEAAWYGVPSIAGIDGGAGDFVDDGVTGQLVDGSQSITTALVTLLSNPQRLKAMGAAAQTKVRTSGMWEQAFEKYVVAAYA